MNWKEFKKKLEDNGVKDTSNMHCVVMAPDEKGTIYPMHFDSIHVDHDDNLVVVRLVPETK